MATFDDLETLSRRDLQSRAKAAGLKANAKSVDIIHELRQLEREKECTSTVELSQKEVEEGCSVMQARVEPWEEPCVGITMKAQPEPLGQVQPVVSSPIPSAPSPSALAAAAPEEFFRGLHQRVSTLIAASPTMRDPSLRKSFTSLSSTLLDAVIASRERSGVGSTASRVFHDQARSSSPLGGRPPDMLGSSEASGFLSSKCEMLSPDAHGQGTPRSSLRPRTVDSGRAWHMKPVSSSPRVSMAVVSNAACALPTAKHQGVRGLSNSSPGQKALEQRRRAFAQGKRDQRGKAVHAARWRL